jgi:hypothetical protein
MTKNSQQSYVQLLNSIRDELRGKFDQKPQLSASHRECQYYSSQLRNSISWCGRLAGVIKGFRRGTLLTTSYRHQLALHLLIGPLLEVNVIGGSPL